MRLAAAADLLRAPVRARWIGWLVTSALVALKVQTARCYLAGAWGY